MIRPYLISCSVMGLLFSSWTIPGPVQAADTPVVLADQGRAEAWIVIPTGTRPDSRTAEAARLLAHFFERMSGVRLDIFQEAQLGAVYVDGGMVVHGLPDDAIIGFEDIPGEAPLPTPPQMNLVLLGPCDLTAELGLNAEGLGPGGLRVRTTGNVVALLGGPDRVDGEAGRDDGGIWHAAIELLEQLGCRYLWPGETGLVIPRKPSLAIPPMDIAKTPLIRRRGIRWGEDIGHERFDTGLQRLHVDPDTWQAAHARALGDAPPVAWTQWHRLGGELPDFRHAGGGLSPSGGWEAHHERHPEWFALQADGTRDQGGDDRFRLCKSNPELIAFVANDIIARVHADPSIRLVSLDPNDGGSNTGFCLCDACAALDHPDGPEVQFLTFGPPATPGGRRQRTNLDHVSLTERMVAYWNAIAEKVTAVHPDLLFGVSAYSRYINPPIERRLHPNLVVRYVPPTTDLWEGWLRMGARRVLWRPNILLQGWHDGKLRSYVGDLAERMAFFADSGMMQTDLNTIRHWWGVHGLNYYAAARLCWDPYLSAEAIIEDYARHGFGAGAEAIQRFFHRIEALTAEGVHRSFEDLTDRRYTAEVLAELRALLNEAEEAVDDDVVIARVRFLRTGLNYTELAEELSELAWRASNREAIDHNLTQRLVDLHTLVLQDLLLHHNLVINVPYLAWRSATFAQYAPIRGRTTVPSDPALLERVGSSTYGLRGTEQGLDDMLQAFGGGGPAS